MNIIISKVFFLLIITATVSVQYVHSVDLDSVAEPCTNKAKPTSIYVDWLMSVKKWHYVLMSRYDLYITSGDILQSDPKELNEDKVYYDSCITLKLRPGDGDEMLYDVTGYGGHKAVYKGKPLANGAVEVSLNDQGVFGIGHTTLTDNKTFFFMNMCFNDGRMAWGALSPYKTLSKETTKLIHEHAESLGYKKEHFTRLRFDSCGKDKQRKQEL